MTGIRLESIEAGLEVEGPIHVYPLFGKAHLLHGDSCWCDPTADDEHPEILIHHVEQ